MASKMTETTIEESLERVLSHHFGTTIKEASNKQMYDAVVISVRDQLLERRSANRSAVREFGTKRVYYLCMEFLLGRSLKNNLYNLEETESYRKVLEKYGYRLEDLYEEESDAGLGNGGLGRLAACFMDSLATDGYAAMGYTIRYEYGLFRQKIVEGWQVELPDVWLPGGQAWLAPRYDHIYEVKFGGEVGQDWSDGSCRTVHTGYQTVEAMPYDMMVSGYGNKAVAALRTWRPRMSSHIDMEMFSNGNHMQAVEKGIQADVIGKVLYPSDNTPDGKSLRLQQQYFLVSASAQDIIRRHMDIYDTLDNFADKNAIHINDTHPALIIPELMRIFLDEYGYAWNDAFGIVCKAVSYTNHTVLAEALEVWPEDMIQRLLPRVHQIIVELNRRYCDHVFNKYPGDWDRCDRMSILSHGMVRMANLSVIGSHKVNGVSAMHSEILKDDVFCDFYQDTPAKFTNVTNGIAYRRWLCQSNPGLCKLLDETIGPKYRTDGQELLKFLDFQDDAAVLHRLSEVKKENKKRLAENLKRFRGVTVDPESIFDVQVKRLHEYKRQLLNAIHIIATYLYVKDNPDKEFAPRTFLFGAKAAPGYDMAKRIIRLIVSLGEEIEKDPKVKDKLRVIFMENYSVSMAEDVMPAADISQQISLAGKEASGTGNMKLMINGAITIGTLDGANKEMAQVLEPGAIYIFGMKENEANRLSQSGYDPYHYYEENEMLRRSVDFLKQQIGDYEFSEMFRYLLMGENSAPDPYMCLADFVDYSAVHAKMIDDMKDLKSWSRKSLQNIAHASYFTADKAIETYAKDIWDITPIK